MSVVVFALLVSTVTAQCGFYSVKECQLCTLDAKGMCRTHDGVPPGVVDRCLGRGICSACIVEAGRCKAIPTKPMTHADMMLGMQMTLYQGPRVMLLFDWWQTEGFTSYLVSLVVVLCFSFGVTIARYHLLQASFMQMDKASQIGSFFLVECALFLLMLITMSYNIGICLAVVIGGTAGWVHSFHGVGLQSPANKL